MGIKSLTKFLKTSYPDIFEPIYLDEIKYKKVAIDTSYFLHKYKAFFDKDWIGAFIKLISSLRENRVHCVFIYDNQYNFPVEKQGEQKKRREQKEKNEDRLFQYEESLDRFHTTGEIDKCLLELQEKRKIPSIGNTINVKALEIVISKLKKQVFHVTSEDYNNSKKILELMNVPYFTSPSESEATCADLCKQGLVYGVISDDSDLLAYGCPIMLTKLDPLKGTVLRINFETLLQETNMSYNEFLDFCIMCGTDYNPNIPKIGPAKSFSYISEFKNIEMVAEKKFLDISILRHTIVRNLFTNYVKVDWKIKCCDIPNFTELEVFMAQKNVKLNINALKKSIIEELKFEED